MGTVLTYRQISLTGCLTKLFHQEPVYDDSGTDLLYHKYRIRVVGYVHGLTVGDTPGDKPGVVRDTSPGQFSGQAVDSYKAIRSVLNEPRGDFSMSIDGQVLLEAKPATRANFDGRDVNNGPKPQSLEITRVTGANIFRVEYEIEIALISCGASESISNTSGVLSNRWSVVDDIDENQFTVRTVQGRLRIATAILNPNSFRGWVVPKLQTGFRREHMTFLVSADGLNLDYTIVDREVGFSAPFPATDWEFSHTEITGDGMIGFGEAFCRLAGPRNANKQALIQLGMQIIDAKLRILHILPGRDNEALFIRNLQITDMYGSRVPNEIQIRCRIEHMQDPQALPVPTMVGQTLGKPIDAQDIANYYFNKSRGHGQAETEGSLSSLAALSAYLQDSCNENHRYGLGNEPDSDSEASIEPLVPIIDAYEVGGELPALREDYTTASHKQSIYTFYQAESQYEVHQSKVQMTIAKSQLYSGSTGGSEDTSAIVALGQPVARRILRVKAERVGEWPVLPVAASYVDNNGILCTLLQHTPFPGVRDRTADGHNYYRAEAEYIYALSRELRSSDSLRVGALPWDAQSPSDTNAPSSTFGGSETSVS